VAEGGLPRLAVLDDQAEGLRVAAHGFGQAGGLDVGQVRRDGLGPSGGEHLVHEVGVDPQGDHGGVERHPVAEHIQDRAVEGHEREPLGPELAEPFEREPGPVVEGAECGGEVGHPALQAHEVEHDQGVGQVFGGVVEPFDQRGHARGVGQDQGQGARVLGGPSALRLGEPGDLGHEDRAVGVVGVLEPEIFPPVEQEVGRGVVGEAGGEGSELVGVLLEEEDRLQVETVEEGEPPEPVRGLDGHRRAGVAIQGAIHEVAILAGRVLRLKCFGQIDFDRTRRLCLVAVSGPRGGLVGDLEEDPQGGEQHHDREHALHLGWSPGTVRLGYG